MGSRRERLFQTRVYLHAMSYFRSMASGSSFFCIRLFPFINALLSSAVAQSCQCARLRLRPSSTLVSIYVGPALGNVFLYLYKALTCPVGSKDGGGLVLQRCDDSGIFPAWHTYILMREDGVCSFLVSQRESSPSGSRPLFWYPPPYTPKQTQNKIKHLSGLGRVLKKGPFKF